MKIGAAQIKLYPDIKKNLRTIGQCLQRAAEEGIDILNFPETALTGYIYKAFLQIKRQDVTAGIEQISDLVKKLGINAVVGAPSWSDSHLMNSVVVFLSDGRRLYYHKNNLVAFEHEYFESGKEILTFDIGKVRFGTIICRDQNYAGLARKVKEAGANVLFISCAHYYVSTEARLKVEKNRALPMTRAYENGMFVCKANAVGTYEGKINLGHSIIIGPNGVVLAEAGETGEEIISFDIDTNNMDWHWE